MTLEQPLSLTDRRRLVAQLALLLPANKRRVLATLAIAAAGTYAATQYAKFSKQNRGRGGSGNASTTAKPKDASAAAHRRRRPSGKALRDILPLLLRVAGRKIVIVVILAIARTALSNRLARLQGYLFRAAFLRRAPLFVRNLAENVALCAVASVLEATSRSWVSYIELQWRRLLTNKLHAAYFDDMTYYKLNYVDRSIDNPEQRVCEDVPKLSAGLAELTRELVNAAVDATFYAWQLQRYSGTNRYTGAILAYVFGAGTFMTVAAPNFGKLFKRQQTLEGAYRQLHSRLRANAEPVAFLGGIAKEGDLIRDKFGEVMAFAARLQGKQWRFSMVQDFLLKYLGATVAVALIIGPFFGGHMRPEATVAGRAQMLSNMRYHTSVIISLFGALGTLGASSRKFLRLGAYADRVDEMSSTMKKIARGEGTGAIEQPTGEIISCEDAIAFEQATVVTPGNATLVRDLNMRVPAGTNLLVTGPNGAGKSSLFRVLGGLWPLTDGRIAKPGGAAAEGGLSHDIFYVPQRPYVTVGTLQDQLLYPLQADATNHIPQDELRALLRSVDLESLLDRAGGGEQVTNWGEVLSLGEQQRLGMARLFFHRPRFAILDECTSGVTVEMEERFCEMVRDMGCTCVTISHRPALMAFHDVVLHLDGEGGWSVHPGHRALSTGITATPTMTENAQQREGDVVEDMPASNGGKDDAIGVLCETGSSSTATATGNIRQAETQAVLQGMKAGGIIRAPPSGEQLLSDGNEGFAETMLASAPPGLADPSAPLWAPRLSLQPSASSSFARWRSIWSVLMGGNTQESVMRLSTVAGVVVLRTLLQDRIASLNGKSVDLVLRQDLNGFIRLIGVSVLQSAASSVLAPSLRHVADRLALTWRSRLTRAIAAHYLSGKSPYLVAELAGMSDVDQRVTRDVERLSDDLAALIPTLVKPVVDVGWFSWQLWRLCGPRGMAVLYAYTAVGYGALRTVTPDFAGLLKKEYGLEGAFRNAHSRLRTHAESIAFFGGGAREGSHVAAAFDALTKHLRTLIGLRWAYGAADEFFAKQLPHSVTWVLTLLYAMDQRGNFGDTKFQGTLVHDMRYLASVVTQCFSSFGELLAMPKRFAELSGGVNRVSEVLEVVRKARTLEAKITKAAKLELSGPTASGEINNEKEDKLEFVGVDVITPGGEVLARQLSVDVTRGASLLISGPNGAGKTSLLRLLAGLWPLPDGKLRRPTASNALFYVPQRLYTTPGSLREQIIYPLTPARARQRFGDEADPPAALDAAVLGLMNVVRLGYLVEREGGLNAVKEWGEVLSLGEQQRVGMARLFFHRPVFGILDEATNATSVDVEEALYEHATNLGITLVSITQRTALVRFHGRELRLIGDGKGDWELREIHQVAGSTKA